MSSFTEQAKEWDADLRDIVLHRLQQVQENEDMKARLSELEREVAEMRGNLCRCVAPAVVSASEVIGGDREEDEEEEDDFYTDQSFGTPPQDVVPPAELVPWSDSPISTDLDDSCPCPARATAFGSDTTLGGSGDEVVFEAGETDVPLPVPGPAPEYYVRGVYTGQRGIRTPSFWTGFSSEGWSDADDWYPCQARSPAWTRRRVAKLRAEDRKSVV